MKRSGNIPQSVNKADSQLYGELGDICNKWFFHTDIINYFGLQLSGNYIQYSVQDKPAVEEQEVKYATVVRSRAKPEYLEKNPTAQRFFTEKGGVVPPFLTHDFHRLQLAVKHAGNILYVPEGDKDTWTHISAGYENTAGLTAANVSLHNRTIITYLEALNVHHVIVFLDNDNAGWQSMQALHELLQKTQIRMTALIVPLTIEHEGEYHNIKDVHDAWSIFKGDVDQYRTWFESLKMVSFPSKDTFATQDDIFNPELYMLIEEALGINEYKYNGWSKHVACPFRHHEHDDTSPAFGWHKDKHFARCLKCQDDTVYLAKDVAEVLGINWRDYINRNKNTDVVPSINSPITAQLSEKAVSEKESGLQNSLLSVGAEVPDYSIMEPDEFMYTLDEAFDNYRGRLSGAITPKFPPIPNPYTSMHVAEGLAQYFMRPMMVGLAGISGGFKSTMLFGLANRLSMAGYHGIIYTPEWNKERNIDRIIAQYGGMSMRDMMLLERYNAEVDAIQSGHLSPDDISIFGNKPDEDVIQKTWKVLSNAEKVMRGKISFVNIFGATILDIMGAVKEAAYRMTEAGTPPSYFIFDYIQMALPPRGKMGYRWDQNDTITLTKALTMQLGMVTFMSTQVRKSDTEDLEEGRILTGTSALGVRDDQFNLFLTVNPYPQVVKSPSTGNPMKLVKIAITKNSLGKRLVTEESAINMYVDLARSVMLEQPSARPPSLDRDLDIDVSKGALFDNLS